MQFSKWQSQQKQDKEKEDADWLYAYIMASSNETLELKDPRASYKEAWCKNSDFTFNNW